MTMHVDRSPIDSSLRKYWMVSVDSSRLAERKTQCNLRLNPSTLHERSTRAYNENSTTIRHHSMLRFISSTRGK